MLLRTAIIIVLVVLILYGGREAYALAAGPSIMLASPENGETFHNGFISITGSAVHTQSVSLDGGPLVTDQNGHFSTMLTLPRGGAILTLTATDRFGRTSTIHRMVAVP